MQSLYQVDGQRDGSFQVDDVIIPNPTALSDHGENSDEESNGDKDDTPFTSKHHRKIDPGFLTNDVVLVIEDEHLHVNKVLMESASPVFEAWLKKDWQPDECSDDTKQELKFPGKTYDDMVTFLKCLLPSFPDKVADQTLKIVLPLADEYQTDKLITECVEVIRQRATSVSAADIYIPPSRIVTYLHWIEKFNLHMVKNVVVKLASYLTSNKLETQPGYENIGLQLKLEISDARAHLLASLFVTNIIEAKERIYQLRIPYSPYYLVEWKQNVAKLVEQELASTVSEKSTWPKATAYRAMQSNSMYGYKKEISKNILHSFACLDISDKLNYRESYSKAIKRIKSLEIGKAAFKFIWSNYYFTYRNANASMERLLLDICDCQCH